VLRLQRQIKAYIFRYMSRVAQANPLSTASFLLAGLLLLRPQGA
jgi:hypothetical protein